MRAFLNGLLRRVLGLHRARETLDLVLYTKADCPLCDQMKAEIGRARVRPRLRLSEVDIERDPELVRRHGRSIPVLEIGGRPAFKGRLTARDLEQKIARHLARFTEGASRGPGVGGESEHG